MFANKKIILTVLVIAVFVTLFGLWFFMRGESDIELEEVSDVEIIVDKGVDVNNGKIGEKQPQIFIKVTESVPDKDKDGISDEQEKELGTSEVEFDTDKDGISDQREIKYGTDPTNPDSDGDGFTDAVEIIGGYNPLGEGKL